MMGPGPKISKDKIWPASEFSDLLQNPLLGETNGRGRDGPDFKKLPARVGEKFRKG